MRYALIPIMFLAASLSAPAAESVYTDANTGCADIGVKRDEARGSMSRCPGPQGYAVVFTDEGNVVDARFGLRGRERNLGGLQWSGGVSARKMEWRMEGDQPVAAIFRASKTDPETSETSEHLVVAKVTPKGGCLIEWIDAHSKGANEKARRIADMRATTHACPK